MANLRSDSLNTEKLAALGVARVALTTSTRVRPELHEIARKLNRPISPITLSCIGIDVRGEEMGTLGFLEAAHAFGSFDYGRKYNAATYINLIYVEEAYRRSGIAAALLDTLPAALMETHAVSSGVLVLAPAPYQKAAPGSYVQLQGLDFWMGKMRLTRIYEHLGFEVVDLFGMVKDPERKASKPGPGAD